MEDIFAKSPFGIADATVPRAQVTESQSTTELVKNQEEDSFYFRSLENNGIHLNKAQLKAVRHVDGPFLTLAGAGSGKTTVLVCRTGYLMTVKKVDPRQLLLVTFTKKAAMEMKARIAKLPGVNKSQADKVMAGTFHSFFLYLLRSQGNREEILSSERQKQIILKQIQRSKGIHDPYEPEVLLSTLSFYKMNLIDRGDWPSSTQVEKEKNEILIAFENWKAENRKMDFDDILVYAYDLLIHNPSLTSSLQKRFQYVMVDEFQDTNLLQYSLIKLLVKGHRNLFIVGDDDQTIYSFNGARNDFILNFDNEFPEAEMTTLDLNYRSMPDIIGLGNEVIRHNKKRRVKMLKPTKAGRINPLYSRPSTTDEEAEWTLKKVQTLIASGKYSYKDISILHRTASSSRAMFERLLLEEVPFITYNVHDQLFYEQWIVKPIIDYLRLALVPRNFEAIEGILPTLFVGREKGIQYILNQERSNRKKYPIIHLTTMNHIKSFQVKKIKDRLKLIKTLQNEKPVDAIKMIRKEFYDTYLECAEQKKVTEHKEVLKETLNELEASAKRFDTVSTFLTFIENMKKKHEELQNISKAEKKDALSLMTIHRSKGLEFPVVFLIGACEGNLPHSSALDIEKLKDRNTFSSGKDMLGDAIEEERRLAYVAITRAEEELYISSPAFYQGEKRDISRFIVSAFQKDTVKKPISKKQIPKTKKKVKAWICTSQECIAWQRIEEGEIGGKLCPLCHSRMDIGIKEV
ncbi:DNA helicase-2/ATP-dependent DNA helicase PcrA [Bacillus pakistanensis]|uniref:DNA 3'-5' helicase n=1 Tax=Rossellomorea pakistanensis TaxID=992288 RepID=A0ABS2NJ26_9BACI|nr:UvrD-helicase domain-containing protein [Bacillus pakistanensis]MBM7587866.1 DNA helicase-2/ATP-dependent DNA helicase PcrA [Bacillus pakistanensis]